MAEERKENKKKSSERGKAAADKPAGGSGETGKNAEINDHGGTDARTEAEIMEEIRQAMARTPVKDFIVQFLETLSSLTYQRLGIYQEPDKSVIDPAQAKLAIDCYASLLESLGDAISEDERRVYMSVLSSLKMQYVQKSG